MNILKAGSAYFVAVFAVGFVLGFIRVVILQPIVGELAAVLIELPFILAASWTLCAHITVKFNVPPTLTARFIMGILAFGLLITAEYMLARYGFGQTSSEQLRDIAKAAGAIGLAGQIIFAMFPLMQIHGRRH